MVAFADGKSVYQEKCSSCHKAYIPMKELKENFSEYNNTKLKLKAPTLNQLSYRLKAMIGDGLEDEEVHEFEVREFIKDYAMTPSKEKSLCHKKVLEAFNTMHSMKGKVTEEELAEVSKYIYHYDKIAQKEHGSSEDSEFEKVLKQAKKEKKLILVKAESENCYYCKKMDKETLSTKEVSEYLKKNFILFKVDVLKKALPAKLNYSVTPTYFFLDSDKKVLNTVPGAWNKKEFLEILKSIKGDKK